MKVFNKNKNSNLIYYFAFTLAEVLIVLGIIGVVAELTIPTVMQNVQYAATVSQLKKSYTTLAQAYMLAVKEDGTPDSWNLVAADSPVGAEEMINKLAPYLKITKNCGTTGNDCFPNVNYRMLDGSDWGNANSSSTCARAQLADGSLLMANTQGNCNNNYGSMPALQNGCGSYRIDVNGFKKPNQYGIDFFMFYLTKDGIVPTGTSQESSSQFSFDTTCKNKVSGRGCTAWVIYNGNMDYLKCNDLDWSTKTKCS